MGLIHCIYASAATQALSEEALGALLRHARTNNNDRGLSGILLHVDGAASRRIFFWILKDELQRWHCVEMRQLDKPERKRLAK